MKITAKVINIKNNSEVEPQEINLIEIPIQDDFVIINDSKYMICHSYFKTWGNGLYYEMEQKIIKIQEVPPLPSYLLLSIKIKFEDERETEMFFKKIKVVARFKESFKDRDVHVFAPLSYLRIYDCIDVEDSILVISGITIIENIVVEVDIFNSPLSYESFTKDENGFCPRSLKGRY